jgi:hypothetical protein
MRVLLDDVFKKVISFLNKEKVEYIIIGGIAAGTLGEPRVTGDIDADILLDKDKMGGFLSKAEKSGFKVNRKRCIETAKRVSVFQINYGDFHVDFIIASTDLEREAFRRKRIIRLYGLKAFFPTPEDLILLKIIPGRPQDLIDAEKVIIRHKEKLDVKYLKDWAQRLSDEAQDLRIYNELKRLLAL